MDASVGGSVGVSVGAPVGGAIDKSVATSVGKSVGGSLGKSVATSVGATVVQAGGRGMQARGRSVSALNVVLWVGGVALVGAAYVRGVPYWRRYQAMRAQQDNIRRYETWRGRPTESGPSSADLMETELRRRAQPWLVAGIVGIVMIVAGFAVR